MLFRLVRPVQRKGSRVPYFVQRIPADVKRRAAGLRLAIPLGDGTHHLTIRAGASDVRLSLRTTDPSEAKRRQAAVAAHFENVWRALREKEPVSLTHQQATALAGEFYFAWAGGAGSERVTSIELGPDKKWRRVAASDLHDAEAWSGVLRRWFRPEAISKSVLDGTLKEPVALDAQLGEPDQPEPADLEMHLGPLIDRQLLAKGVARVDEPSREILLVAFWEALRDAFKARLRNAQGDYSADPVAARFPKFQPAKNPSGVRPASGAVSLKGLVEEWWKEAQATGRKRSTYESYRNTMAAFVAFLKHDDAARVTKQDVINFKDHRLASVNEKTGKPISPKTVKDSDLAGLKTVSGWAVANLKIDSNPAEGVTLKVGKKRKLRSKGFTDTEALAILKMAHGHKRGQTVEKTHAAKRWVPFLCAYSGSRVGECAQLRKEDVRKEGKHWVATLTPEAGTVKTNEARDVVLHQHLIDLGFIDFVRASPPGHLFVRPSKKGNVLGPLKGLTNRLAEFVRAVVPDKNVAPNHGWRHRFKTIGLESDISPRVLDAIQGHKPRTEGESYGDVTVKAMAAAMAKFPRYKIKA